MKYKCPCCNYLTFSEEPPGTFEICPVCYWEDDDTQFNDPNFFGGSNEESLNKAKENFLEFGAISKKYLSFVRKPNINETPNN